MLKNLRDYWIIKKSGLFDPVYYLMNYPDVRRADIDPLMHFIQYGWKEGRNPSDKFDTNDYLKRNINIIRKNENPILHSLFHKKITHRYLTFKKIANYLFPDNSFRYVIYRNFINFVFKILDSIPEGILSKLCPPLFYINIARKDGRFLNNINEELQESRILESLTDIEFFRIRTFNIVPYFLNPNCQDEMDIKNKNIKIAIHLHLFYQDMIELFGIYLSNIPFQFDLFISTAEWNDTRLIEKYFRDHVNLINHIIIRKVPNRGRDLAPMIIEFGKDLEKYQFICHIHSKKSPHRNQLNDWFEQIMEALLGSPSYIIQIINLLVADAKFVYPDRNRKILLDKSGWGSNYDIAKTLVPKLLNRNIFDFPIVEFPEGSMFWAKKDALQTFLNFSLNYSDFPEEPIPPDGTIAHTLERLLLLAALRVPGRNYKICSALKGNINPFYEVENDYSLSISDNDVKILSYFLPQFYSIPENDKWHGKGFTEWTNLRKTNPLFYSHDQQRAPHPDIGYYSLDSTLIMKKQAELMKKSGIYGQIFYHYWFNGKLILEKPAQLLLADTSINMRFCFCWANENWTKKWDGNEDEILLSQEYSQQDASNFITYLIPFFKDDRYIKINGRPLLFIYRPSSIPDFNLYKNIWQNICKDNGFEPPFVVAILTRGARSPKEFGMDAGCERVLHDWTNGNVKEINNDLYPYWPINGSVLNYEQVADYYMNQEPLDDFIYFRSLIPSWDNTPRYDSDALIVHKSTPKIFQEWLEKLIFDSKNRLPFDKRFIIINAWNEWAESAVLEPDCSFGYAYLNSIGRSLSGIGFDEREYLTQLISNNLKLTINLGDDLINSLKFDERLRRKMITCIGNSTIFLYCKVFFRQEQVIVWLKEYFDKKNWEKEECLEPNYELIINGCCIFPPNTIELMVKMALQFDTGIVNPSHRNDQEFTHKKLSSRWEIDQPDFFMMLKKNGEIRSMKCCVDANIFITSCNKHTDISQYKVSSVIRFNKEGNINLLKNALYSLLAQTNCCVQPIICIQDPNNQLLSEIENIINNMPWDDNCFPIIKKYYTTEDNTDLRSLMLNDSLKSIKTKYAAFLDYDDILFYDAYSWLINRLETTHKNAAFGLIYTTICNSLENQIKERIVVYNYGTNYDDFLKYNHSPLHGFMLNLSKININNIIFFKDMHYLEDYFLTLQIFSKSDSDWNSLKERKFIGDYCHYEDKQQTLAVIDENKRDSILKSSDYIYCETKINQLKNEIRKKDKI